MDRRQFMAGAASVALVAAVPVPGGAAPIYVTGTVTGRWTNPALYEYARVSRVDMKRLLLARAYGGDAHVLEDRPQSEIQALNDVDWSSIERRIIAHYGDGRDPYDSGMEILNAGARPYVD